jgi:hypothetical protein
MATVLGPAQLPDHALAAVVSEALRRPVELVDWAAERVDYAANSPATGALVRVRGSARDQAGSALPWSVFVKVLQSPRHWPLIRVVPPDQRAEFIDTFPWRAEAEVLGSDLRDRLPAGLRLPRLFYVDELGDDRVAVWMEDIVEHEAPWDLARFRRAARLLGRWAGRQTEATLPPAQRALRGLGLRHMVRGRVDNFALPLLGDDGLWRHPLLAELADGDLRRDLLRLAGRIPTMLDRLDSLPQALGHGDACPQNLLVPRDAPDTFVGIDVAWPAWGAPQAIGFDLGQLLVGLAHAGTLPASELDAVHRAIVPAFADGLADEGCAVAPADLRYGYEAALVLRSGFTAIPFEKLAEPPGPELRAELAQRLALTRFIVDLGLRLNER